MNTPDPDPVMQDIETLMDEITTSCDRLEDCMRLNPENQEWERPVSRDGSGAYPEFYDEGGVFRDVTVKGGGGSFNLFPGVPGACHDTMLLILPRQPHPRQLGHFEAQHYADFYFNEAAAVVHHWAEKCKGRRLVILSDTWPIPEVPMLPNQNRRGDSFRWHDVPLRMSRRLRRGNIPIESSTLHGMIGRILVGYRISCHMHLFVKKSQRVMLGESPPGQWPTGW